MSIIQGTSKAAGGGYEIDQSIRFDKTTSSHLSKTYGSAGNRKTWTFSTWFKRGKIDGTRQILFAATGQAYLQVGPDAASREMITILNEGSGTDLNWYTTAVYRDPSAWYHLVWQFDSTQADADNRTKLYINGSQVTAFTKAATPAQNFEGAISNAVEHKIGEGHTAANYFDGYQAEINFIDGQALAPTDFGEFNDDGVWVPIAYTGSATGNSFYITGEDSADLGADYSGNGNDFTSSGLTSADQMLDTPTDNYCVLSPIDKNSNVTLKDGNLVASAGGGWYHGRGTLFAPSGKWYYEWIPTAGSYAEAGWMLNVSGNDYAEEESDVATTFYRGIGAAGHGFRIGSSATDSAVTNFSLNDVIMMAIDVDTMKMWVGINGTWYNSGDPAGGTNPVGTWTDAVGQSVAPWYGLFTSTSETFNFGQRPFEYTIPTGFNSWNTANLPTPSITDGSAHFQPTLYTGNGTAIGSGGLEVNQSGNSTFQPDWVWIKSRSNALSHFLTDVVRGATNYISSNNTDAEGSASEGLVSFDSDGFTVGSSGGVNTNSATYVAWQWKANGAGSSNEDGSINTTATSVNTTAGFSISTFTGTGANATVGHGLGIAPSLVIIKSRNDTHDWYVWTPALATTEFLQLNSSAAKGTASPEVWNSTAPTSSVVNIGTSIGVNRNTYNYVMYCFAEIPGYSSIGSYKGNSSTDGTFVYTGFRPSMILWKQSTGGNPWGVRDTARDPFNVAKAVLRPSGADAETTASSAYCDILSNGFKLRATDGFVNNSASTYIYMAFAENPFGGDGVAPATAR
jgi:hypothetical protein